VNIYSISLDRASHRLFAYVEIESEQLWEEIAETESCRRWWSFMKHIMHTNADGSPVAVSMDEVFHLE
jgi:L-rhamnose mutarotase